MNRSPPSDASLPPPRLSNPHSSLGSKADRRTPVDTLGYYEMMGYDAVESTSIKDTLLQQASDRGTASRASVPNGSASPSSKSPFLQQIATERNSLSPVQPVRGVTNPQDPYGYMDMIGYGGDEASPSSKFVKPMEGEYHVPGYPEQRIRAAYPDRRSARDSEETLRHEVPAIPSLNQPIIPELDHTKFDHIQALETVPPFNPKWVDPQPLFNWLMPPKAPRQLDRPNLPGEKRPGGARGGGKAGVGLSVSPDKEGEWTVSAVHPTGPAAQTGMIDPGDTIKACNGVVLKGYPRQSVIDAMTGPPATQAVMLVEKAKTTNVITVFVSRDMLDGSGAEAAAEEEDGLFAHQRFKEREETEEERDLRLELENVELRKRLAKLKGEPAGAEKDPSILAKIQSWGWDLTTLTKKPHDYIAEELPVLELPGSLQPVGFLDIEVIEARNLPRVDILGAADPYVRVLCHGQLACSGIQKNTLHPHWGEILAVNIFDPRQTLHAHKLRIPDQMQVQLCSWKSTGKDELIGAVLFSAGELCGGLDEKGVGEGWYDVQRERRTGGMEAVKASRSQNPCQLYLRFTYTKVPMEVRNTLDGTPSMAPV